MNHFTALRVLNGAADTFQFVYEALDVFTEHFVALCVLLYVAGEFTGRAFYRWHAAWVATPQYPVQETSVVAPVMAVRPQAAVVPQAPAVQPLYATAAALEAAYSVRTFQATHGVRKARTKHQQIASFIAR